MPCGLFHRPDHAQGHFLRFHHGPHLLLSASQAQLDPHLLFNLLASLQNSIYNRSQEETSAHLVRVTKLVREVLEFSIQPEASSPYQFPTIAVARELDFLENYLHLMAMQQHPPFRYVVENTLQTPAETLVVPPLSVQPLVENAILHGIRPLSGREGEIRVRVTEDGGRSRVFGGRQRRGDGHSPSIAPTPNTNGQVSYVHLIASQERPTTSTKILGYYAALLEARCGFFKLSRKFLVNLRHVASLNSAEDCVCLTDGKKLIGSRDGIKALGSRFRDMYGRDLG